MKGRPVIFENETLVNKAQKVFWEKGYTATSLSDLLEITGAGSGSFYNTFKGGKKEVFRKAILQRREAFNDFKIQLSKSSSPLDLVKDFFRSIAEEDRSSHLRGCIIANTVVEMTYVDPDLESEAVKILKEVEQMFTNAIGAAQKSGKLKNKTAAPILGRYLLTFWCGLNTLRRMYPDKKNLRLQIDMQLEILD